MQVADGKRLNILTRPPLPPLPKGGNYALALIQLAVTFLVSSAAHAQVAENAPNFEHDVLPLLKAHCVKCHNSQDSQGGLDLSSGASLMKGSDEGPVVIKGLAEK